MKPSGSMPEVPSGSVHLAMTSPPYPMVAKWDSCLEAQAGPLPWHDPMEAHRMMLEALLPTWRECVRALAPGGILCINMGDATRSVGGRFRCFPNCAMAMSHAVQLGLDPLVPIVWRKISNRPNAFLGSGFLPVNIYVSQDCELVMIFRKGGLRQFSPEEAGRRRQSRITRAERDLWCSQVWDIPGRRGARETSSWPREVPYRLVRMFSIVGDTVLDPFCGQGDEELCISLGRHYIGYTLPPAANAPA